MHKFLFSVLFLFISINFSIAKSFNVINNQPKVDECYTCHLDDESSKDEPANLYKTDIHFINGITCAGCHGGDSNVDDMDEAMDKNKGFIGIPNKSERFKLCVKCHSDSKIMKSFGSKIPTNQFEKLKGSVHFAKSVNSKAPIADCVTCHSVHNIASVKNPASKVYPTKVVYLCKSCHSNASFMKQYNPGLPVNQYNNYRTSLHGKQNAKGDANVANCASCHGNHGILSVKNTKSPVYPLNIPKLCSKCHSNKKLMNKYNLPHNQYDDYLQSVHGEALFVKHDISSPVCNDCHGNHGITRPDVKSIANICGTCHAYNAELFVKSPHKKAFNKLNYPECITCHGNHKIVHATDDLLGIQKDSKCVMCHKNNPNDKGYFIALEMKTLIDSLKRTDTISTEILKTASTKGMDVSESEYALKKIKQVFIQARTISHLSDIDEFKKKINEGFEITSKAQKAGIDAIDEYYFRRLGLGIASIVITFLVVLLYIKSKRLEKGKK